MKISKNMRRGYALTLAAVLTLPCLSMVKTQAAKDRSEFQIYTSIEADDGSYVGFESKSYSQETADRLAAMCETLDKPVKEDAKIRQVLAECLGEYLKGAQSEEETVQKIEEELKMYLAE